MLMSLAAVAGTALATQVPLGGEYSITNSNDRVLNAAVLGKISKTVAEYDIPGFSVGIYRSGAVKEEEYGQWGTRTEAGDPVTENTIFGIASMSKAFTATALGLVMDDFAHGRNVTPLPEGLTSFTWDTKLKDLLPNEWKLMDEDATQHARVRDILAHVSGLQNHFLALSRGEANIDIIRRMRHLRPAYAFREHWHYNDIQYMVAQHLVERFSGMPLGDFVAQHIFVPLNMTSSTYSIEYAISTGHLSESYEFGGRRIPHWLEKEDMPVVAGAGGIMSSAVDLLKWGRAMLGVTNTTVVGIPREILERCMSPEATIDASLGRTYGFGWGQGVMMGTKVVTHSGGLPGVTSLIALLPEHNAVITLQCSAEGKEDANRAVLAELLAAIINSDDDSKDTLDQSSSSSASTQQAIAAEEHVEPAITSSSSQGVDLDLKPYMGTHTDPGYGSITLCSFVDSSPACRQVLDDFATLQGGDTELDTTKLYGYFNRPTILAKYVVLTPQGTHVSSEGSISTVTFSLVATTIFPQGYGANTTAFQIGVDGDFPIFRAEFVVEVERDGSKDMVADADDHATVVKGLGLFGLAGEAFRREREGKTVEEKAEVWFSKVA